MLRQLCENFGFDIYKPENEAVVGPLLASIAAKYDRQKANKVIKDFDGGKVETKDVPQWFGVTHFNGARVRGFETVNTSPADVLTASRSHVLSHSTGDEP